MFFIILIRFLVSGIVLQYDFQTAVGQIIFDSSGNQYDGILGKNLLVESIDAILTDRGAYFTGGQQISIPPNNLFPNTILPITTSYLFVIGFKPISAGCLLSITNGATVKMQLC